VRNRRINKYKFLNTTKNSKYPSKYSENFCPAIGNIGIMSVHSQPRLFLLFIFVGKGGGGERFGKQPLTNMPPKSNDVTNLMVSHR
jgi:hypothetical protein